MVVPIEMCVYINTQMAALEKLVGGKWAKEAVEMMQWSYRLINIIVPSCILSIRDMGEKRAYT